MKKTLTAFAVILVFVLYSKSLAWAVESEKISLYPTNFQANNPKSRSWFILNLSHGQKIDQEVTIQNKGNETANMEIYSVDASANADGAFTLMEKGRREDVGGWVKLPVKSVAIPANSKISLPFSIEVPSLVLPGDHVGGIAVEQNNKTDLSTSGVKLIKRTGVRIYISVNGQKLESLEVKDVRFTRTPSGTFLYYTVKNTGNTNLDLSGTVELKSVLGTTIYNPGPLGEVLAGKSIIAKIPVRELNPLTYSAGINLSFGKNGRISKYVPYFSVSLIVGLVLGALIIVFVIFTRFKSGHKINRGV